MFCWQTRSQVFTVSSMCSLYWLCLSSITTPSNRRFSSWQQFHCLSRTPTHWNGGRLQNKNLSESQYDGWCVPHCYSLPTQMRKQGAIDGRAKLFSYCFQCMWKASSIINQNHTYHMLCCPWPFQQSSQISLPLSSKRSLLFLYVQSTRSLVHLIIHRALHKRTVGGK